MSTHCDSYWFVDRDARMLRAIVCRGSKKLGYATAETFEQLEKMCVSLAEKHLLVDDIAIEYTVISEEAFNDL